MLFVNEEIHGRRLWQECGSTLWIDTVLFPPFFEKENLVFNIGEREPSKFAVVMKVPH